MRLTSQWISRGCEKNFSLLHFGSKRNLNREENTRLSNLMTLCGDLAGDKKMQLPIIKVIDFYFCGAGGFISWTHRLTCSG